MLKQPLIVTVVATVAMAVAPAPLRAQQMEVAATSTDHLGPEVAAELDAIGAATARYRDVETALADGYVRDPSNLCSLPAEEGLPVQLGAMGIHFFRPDLLGITATAPRVDGTGTHTDFTQPGVLIYIPDATGGLELGAVENLVFEKAWKEAGNTGPPEFHGRQYWHRIDNPATTDVDEAHMFEPHYELHIWVHKDNPSGIFSPYNPAASCDHHDGPTTMAEALEYLKTHAPPANPES